MIIPTKIVPVYKTLIYKAMQLLGNSSNDISYMSNYHIFSNIVEYTDVMTILFALGYLDGEKVEVKKNDLLNK